MGTKKEFPRQGEKKNRRPFRRGRPHTKQGGNKRK